MNTSIESWRVVLEPEEFDCSDNFDPLWVEQFQILDRIVYIDPTLQVLLKIIATVPPPAQLSDTPHPGPGPILTEPECCCVPSVPSVRPSRPSVLSGRPVHRPVPVRPVRSPESGRPSRPSPVRTVPSRTNLNVFEIVATKVGPPQMSTGELPSKPSGRPRRYGRSGARKGGGRIGIGGIGGSGGGNGGGSGRRKKRVAHAATTLTRQKKCVTCVTRARHIATS